VTGEQLLGGDRSPHDQAIARDEPGADHEHEKAAECEHRPVFDSWAFRHERSSIAARPGPDDRPELEQGADEEPEAEPAPETAKRRRERDSPPPAACEKIDCRGEERQQCPDQDEFDRPAPHDS
jgi:hypothetical protein